MPRPTFNRTGVFWCSLALAIVVVLPCGYINMGDGLSRFAETKSLLLRGSVSVPDEMTRDHRGVRIEGLLPGRGGRLYSKYGLGMSLVWLMPASVAWLAHKLTGISFDLLAQFAISLVNPVITLITAWSIDRIL